MFDSSIIQSQLDEMEGLISKYSVNVASPSHSDTTRVSPWTEFDTKPVLFITGTTGSLGSYLLSSFLSTDEVTKVYAFNRPGAATIRQRHSVALRDKGLDVSILSDKRLVLLEGDLSKEDFDLDHDMYEQVQSSVTLIIHAAWPMNWARPVSYFERSIHGASNLIRLAKISSLTRNIRFLFISSFLSCVSFREDRYITENTLGNPRDTIGMGYGQSKYVVDRILEGANLPDACTLRVGQVSGSQGSGVWAPTEWVPAIVKSSTTVGAMPFNPGFCTWLPSNVAAQVIEDIARSPTNLPLPLILNITNPTATKWMDVMWYINIALVQERIISEPLKFFPPFQWIEALRTVSLKPGFDVSMAPSIRIHQQLVAFLHEPVMPETAVNRLHLKREISGFGPFETTRAQRWSPTLRNAEAITSKDALEWVRYWKAKGMLTEAQMIPIELSKL